MRILVVHNRYRAASPSGENVVVDDEIAQLTGAGHTVIPYLRSSDELDDMPTHRKIALASSPVHSRRATDDVAHLITAQRPQVLHLHNPYPLVSMSVVRLAATHGIPVVHTVHNYRHTCMKGTYERDGAPCRDCLQTGRPWPGVVHACYRESRMQSAVMAAALLRHRSTRNLIDRFISVSPPITDSLIEAGVDRHKIREKANAVRDPGPPTLPGDGFAFVGRLSEEKGLLDLLHAWQQHPVGSLGPLRIAGDGPLADTVRRIAGLRPDIHVAGRLDPDGVGRLLRACAAVVVPSRWAEPLGLVVLEALAAGRPLLVTDRGALPLLVGAEVGRVVSTDVADLARGLGHMMRDRDRLIRMGAAARRRYEAHYRPEIVTEQLLAIYDEVIQTKGVAG